MNAAFQAQIANAATTAQSILGETFSIAGDSTEYSGVMEEIDNTLPPGVTGYEVKRTLMITATSAQFSSAPTAATRKKVTARGSVWTMSAVRPGPFHYHLTCVAT